MNDNIPTFTGSSAGDTPARAALFRPFFSGVPPMEVPAQSEHRYYSAFFSCTLALCTAISLLGLYGCSKQPGRRAGTGGTGRASTSPAALAAPVPGPMRGIFAWCWSAADGRLTNLIPMLWVRNADLVPPAATAIAEASRAVPPGRTALFFWNAAPGLLSDPLNTCRTADGKPTPFPSPWLSQGAQRIAKKVSTFFRQYRAAGGRLNYIVLDYEAGLTSWQLSLPEMKAIERDPRSAKLEKELGFRYLSSAFFAGPNRRSWNLAMGKRVAGALDTAFFHPARVFFPLVHGSNFDGIIMRSPHVVPDINGHYQTHDNVFGDCQSPAFYGKLGGLAYAEEGGRPYGDGPFAILRYELKYLQAIQESSRAPVVPWIAYRGYAKTQGYYKELIYQLAMRGINQFLYWNPRQLDGQAAATPRDDRSLSTYLATLRRRLGRRPGRPITAIPVHWGTDLLVAARKTESGGTLYRVTAPPGTTAVVEFPSKRRIPVRGRTGIWVASGPNVELRFKVAPPTRHKSH